MALADLLLSMFSPLLFELFSFPTREIFHLLTLFLFIILLSRLRIQCFPEVADNTGKLGEAVLQFLSINLDGFNCIA